MLNKCGRTKQEQLAVERELKKAGSLWPKFRVLHKYIFTQEEFDQVKEAKRIIVAYEEKCKSLLN